MTHPTEPREAERPEAGRPEADPVPPRERIAARPARPGRSRTGTASQFDGDSPAHVDTEVSASPDAETTIEIESPEDIGEPEDDAHEPTLVLSEAELQQIADSSTLAARPAPRRRWRWLRWTAFAVAVALLLGLVIGGQYLEGYARRTANARISDAISKAFNTTAEAQVTDTFVLRSLYSTKRLDGATFTAPNAVLKHDKGEIRFQTIEGRATGITNPLDQNTSVIEQFDGSARLSYPELSKLAGVTVRAAEPGRVRIDRPIEIFGATINVQIVTRPSIDPKTRRIILNDPQARASVVPVPGPLLRGALRNHEDKMVLPPIPHLSYQSISADKRGLTVTVRGLDVPVRELEAPR